MFTGIVDAVGRVVDVEKRGGAVELTIEAPYTDLKNGESVAVSGACLTVVEARHGRFKVQTVATTLGRTRFGSLRTGDRVNLERALRTGDRIGGHIVQGHVDGVAKVVRVRAAKDQRVLDLRVDKGVGATTVLHGSITVDGVSLTVNALPKPGTVQISLIPYTLAHTTLGDLEAGDSVHIEADVIGKYVQRNMAETKKRKR